MHHSLSPFKIAALAALSTVSLGLMGVSAQAVDYSGEAHCFERSSNTGDKMLYPEDRYANGTMQDEDQIRALEKLTKRQWSLRLVGLPFEQDRITFSGQFENGLNGKQIRYDEFDAGAAILLDEAQERRNRRTGSRYMYVPPAMKKLARDRSEIRALKQKPCNKHILYLGG